MTAENEARVCGCNDPDQHQTAKPIQSGDVLMMLDSHMRFTTLTEGEPCKHTEKGDR